MSGMDEIVAGGGRDLVKAAIEDALPPAWLRESDAAAALEQLDQRRSVLLVGAPGVGKTGVVHAIARAMAEREAGALAEVSTTSIMSGTRYLGEWETKVTDLFDAAAAEGVVLYLSDVWNLPYAGRTSNSERNLLDAIRPYLQARRVAVLAEGSPEVLREMERKPHFADLFHKQVVQPLTEPDVDRVLVKAADALGLDIEREARGTAEKLTSRFLPSRPQPGPAIELLRRARDYVDEKMAVGEEPPITSAFIERVFAIHTGLPLFVVSRQETRRVDELRGYFRERIVGQEQAIEAVVETIALFKAGLHDPERPIGTFLFVGPTGVGKTELARALAGFLFGSPNRLLRFDLSEFKDYHAFEQLIGSPRNPHEPARLLDPVRAQPFQVVLLDELEKAHPNVWDLLLPVLDEGRLSPPSGGAVDFRRTILVATSNVGAEEASKLVGFGSADAAARSARTRAQLERQFRPEFLNRFQHIVVFHALDEAQVRLVARHELKRILSREGVASRNLVVDVDDAALDLVIARGYDARWGARGLKRELQHQIVLPLAMVLMEHELESGQLLRVGVRDGRVQIRVIDTAESREARREREPVKVDGKKLDRAAIAALLGQLGARVDSLAVEVGEGRLQELRAMLERRRDEPTFWQDAEEAARTLRDLDRLGLALDRVARLRDRVQALVGDLGEARTRSAIEHVAERLHPLEDSIANARRELVLTGPDGHWDALVEIAPVGGREARDLLVRLYLAWAKHRGMRVEWLREPLGDDEAAMLAIHGRYGFGMLQGEAGLHRVRAGEHHVVARVRVAPWDDRPADRVDVGDHRALKREGAYGGRVRSRLVCGALVLQNARTLAENRELALELLGPWAAAPPSPEIVVRRYEPDLPLVRDRATGITLQRPDALSAERLDALLCARLETSPGTEDGAPG